MPLHLWNYQDYFRKLPPVKIITFFGKRKWDLGVEYKSPKTSTGIPSGSVFTMPSFARHGRWGNIVFQYLFMRILEINNNGKIELSRKGSWINGRMSLYDDMHNITPLQTRSGTILLDSCHLFFGSLYYIPRYFWRAMYVSRVRLQKCFILKDAGEAINNPLPLPDKAPVEVEGLFMVNPKLYKKHKEFILSKLFQPDADFKRVIETCVQQFGQNKTIIGIHIRRGDFIQTPLQQSFQFPIAVKYILDWLASGISSFKNPVIFVCSDDSEAYKEIEKDGFEVFTTKKLYNENEVLFRYEQLEWEILRRCDVILNSNSTFCFSASFLNPRSPTCYRYSLTEKAFVCFDPWESEPLQFCTSSPYLWSYLYARFTLVANMANTRSACLRLMRDVVNWIVWKTTKAFYLYFIYGISLKFFGKLLNFFELFQFNSKQESFTDYNQIDKIKL